MLTLKLTLGMGNRHELTTRRHHQWSVAWEFFGWFGPDLKSSFLTVCAPMSGLTWFDKMWIINLHTWTYLKIDVEPEHGLLQETEFRTWKWLFSGTVPIVDFQQCLFYLSPPHMLLATTVMKQFLFACDFPPWKQWQQKPYDILIYWLVPL